MTSATRARSAQEWGAVLPQWLGMAGLIFCAMFWAATGRIEPLLLSAFGGLIFVGQAGEALVALRQSPPPTVATQELDAPPATTTNGRS